MKNAVLSRQYFSSIKFLAIVATNVLFVGKAIGQDVPVFLRSNYVERRIIKTRADDFGVTRLAKGILFFVRTDEVGFLGRSQNQKLIYFSTISV